MGLALATGPAPAQPSIYTCIDAKGKRLTADRPIRDCLDREQKELNPSGTVRRTVAPSLTGQERVTEEAKARRVAEEQARVAEEKKRDRILLDRYPDAESHARARAAALQLAQSTLDGNPTELSEERRRINMRFDAELARLRMLWPPQRPASAPS